MFVHEYDRFVHVKKKGLMKRRNRFSIRRDKVFKRIIIFSAYLQSGIFAISVYPDLYDILTQNLKRRYIMNSLKKKRWMVYLAICLVITAFFASCSKEEPEISDGFSSGQVTALFRSFLYKDGKVYANHPERFESTEWAIVVKSSETPLNAFTSITGVAAPSKEEYEYGYVSSDGKCSIRIIGQLNAGEDAVYATMYIQIEDCPEITRIHFTTEDFLKGTNDDYVGTEPGVPVIW